MSDPLMIECKLHREGGTHAEIDGVTYHFKPRSDGAHVARVDRDDHIERFLAIPEGYRLYRPAQGAAPAPEGGRALETPVIDGGLVSGADDAPTQAAPPPDEAGLREADQAATDDGPHLMLAQMTDDELHVEHERVVGRKAHPKSGRDTLIAKIRSAYAGG